MDAVQTATSAWLTSIAASPLLGALSMFLLIVATAFLRPWLSWWQGGAKLGSPDMPWQSHIAKFTTDLCEQTDAIADHLKAHVELLRRQCEALERIERLMIEQRSPRDPSAPPKTNPRRLDPGRG